MYIYVYTIYSYLLHIICFHLCEIGFLFNSAIYQMSAQPFIYYGVQPPLD